MTALAAKKKKKTKIPPNHGNSGVTKSFILRALNKVIALVHEVENFSDVFRHTEFGGYGARRNSGRIYMSC